MATVLRKKSLAGAKFTAEGGGWVLLRLISAAEYKEIRRQTVKKGVDYPKLDGKYQRFEFEDVDMDLQNSLFWNACILDFGEWVDEAGNPYGCTAENKAILMTEFEEFAILVNEGIQKLTEDRQQRAEDAEKN